MSHENSWSNLLKSLRSEVGEDSFGRWFSGLQASHLPESRELLLEVPNSIHQLWIESNYKGVLERAVIEHYEKPLTLRFEIAKNVPEPTPSKEPADSEIEDSASDSDIEESQPSVPVAAKGAQPPAGRTTEERALFPESETEDAEKAEEQRQNESEERRLLRMGINPHYSFENFVVGGNCQFAAAAAKAVIEKPGRVYNPLFLYGGTGLGKTHLMHSIGQAFLREHATTSRKRKPQVVYLTSEEFTNEFVSAIAKGSMAAFRRKYRKADLLLIDDVQFLADKDSTQEEFFHTFNALFDAGKQIVLTSDRPPSEVSELEHRLVSRFEWGLTTELLPPSLETRTAILQRKAEEWKVKVPQEIMDYLAGRIRSNVRRLEGALIRIASYAALGADKLDQAKVDELLKDILREEVPRAVKIEKIQRLVAEAFELEFADMMSKARPRRIAFPRQIAMYLARELSGASLKEIGRAFGGRDHGTVLYAHRLITGRIEDDPELKLQVDELKARLGTQSS